MTMCFADGRTGLLTFLLALAVLALATPVAASAAPLAEIAVSASAAPAPLRLAASIICGNGGCMQVHTKQEKKRKFQTLGHG